MGGQISKHCTGQFVPRRSLLGTLVAYAFAGSALANPTAPTVVNGTANFATAGKTLTVTNSPNAIINWRAFSINAGETTRFAQQSASSAVLNRVVGQDPSAILGTLSSNGRVFLLNPNGIVFGAGSRVDVAGLVASTLYLSNQDFLAGRLNFETGATANPILNHGNIVTPVGGRVYLIAPNVENHGVISTPQGQTIIAAGKTVQLVEADVPNLRVEVKAGGEAVNVGQILADGGSAGIYAGLINQKGIVRADSASRDAAGNIVFRASGRTTLDAGSLTTANGGTGGRIEVTGAEVGLLGNARVEARGEKGGGTVLVGGDYQGKNPDVPNARAVYMGPDAVIDASAVDTGDGGKLIVWSDQATRAYGTLRARGGAQAGNGGLIETSGHFLDVNGIRVDASALRGRNGTWLLDPTDITITHLTGSGTAQGSPPTFTFDPGGNSSITDRDINATLDAVTDVVIQTSGGIGGAGDITVDGAVAILNSLGGPRSLSLRANRTIHLIGGASISGSASHPLNVTLNADTDADGGAILMGSASSITSFGGNILLGGGSGASSYAIGEGSNNNGIFLNGATLNAGAGSVTLRGRGRNSGGLNNGIYLDGGTSISSSTSILIDGLGGAAGGAGQGNNGFVMTGASVISATGSGTIDITGTGGVSGGAASNNGINLFGTATIQSANGSILLTGSGTGTTQDGNGILTGGSLIESTGSGNVTLIGTGTQTGGGTSYGTQVNSTTVRVASGTLSITGTGGTVGSGNHGVAIENSGIVESTGSGNIVITGYPGAAGTGIASIAPGGNRIGKSTMTGNITLTADTIDFSNNATIISNGGQLTLQPLNANTSIGVGGGASGTFNLDAAEIASLQNGFSKINIGRSNGTGVVSVTSAAFTDPLLIRAPVGAGTISVTGALSTGSGGNVGDISLVAGDSIAMSGSGSIITQGQAVTLHSDADNDLSGAIQMLSGTSIVSNSGNIVLGGGANPAANPARGNATINQGVLLSGATLNSAAGTISVRGTGYSAGSGVEVSNGGLISANGGSILLEGDGTTAGGHGVFVDGGTTTVRTIGAGNLNVTGRSYTTTPSPGYHAIRVLGATVESTGSGSVILNGDASIATYFYGVSLESGAIVRTTGSGAIDIQGTSGWAASGGVGVALFDASVSSTGTSAATINVTGTAGNPVTTQRGIVIRADGANTLVSSTAGNITIQGTGGTGIDSQGLLVMADNGYTAGVQSNGSAAISISGSNGNTSSPSVHTTLYSVTGVTRIGGPSATGNIAINGLNSSYLLLSGGAVETSGNVTLTADDMSINGGAGSVIGNVITVRPNGLTRPMEVANSPSGSALGITPTEMQALSASTKLVLGRNDATSGSLTLVNALSSADVAAPTLELAHRNVILNANVDFSAGNENLQLTPGTGGTDAGNGLSINVGTGALTNNGILRPAGQGVAGSMSVTGNLVLGGGSVVEVDIGGTTPGSQYDQVAITGNLTLGGDIRYQAIGGYTASTGSEAFAVLAPSGTTSGSATVSELVANQPFALVSPTSSGTLTTAALRNYWTGSTGNWNSVSWSRAHKPTSTEDAVINQTGGTYTVTLDTTETPRSLVVGGDETLLISTGTLTLNSASMVESGSTLNLAGGTFQGTGNVTVNGNLNWTGGVIAGPGTLDVNGVLSMTTSANRTLSNRTLNHTNTSGSSGWDGAGQWLIDTGAVFRNAVGGKFNVASGGSDLNSSSGTGTFDNQGLLTKSGAGSVRIGPSGTVAFSNSGTVDVTGGTLQSFDGGTHVGGTFTVANGTLMQMSGGTNDFQGATTVSGAGTGSLQWDNSGSVTLSSGTLTVNSGASLNVGNVVVSGTGALTMNSGSTLNVSSGTLGNTGAITVNGAMNWTGGVIAGPGTLDVNGVLSMTTSANRYLSNRTLNHTNTSGSSGWDGAGQWLIDTGAVFRNAVGGKFNVASGGSDLNSSSGTGTFDNQGLLTKSGAGSVRIGPSGTVAFSNSGTVDVTGGTLQSFDGGTHVGGTFTVANGTLMQMSGGTNDFQGATTVSGAGTGSLQWDNSGSVTLSSGTLTVNSGASLNVGNVVVSGTGALTMNSGSTLNVSSGTLGNTGAITVNGAMNWTGGVIAGPGTLDVNGVLSMTTSANRYLSNRTLNHTNTSGSSGWDGAGQWLIDTGAVFRNAVGGKFNVASGGSDLNSSSGTGTFDNQGLLTKSGAGSVRIGPSGTVAFSNSGTVDVTGGTLQSFDGGTHVGGTFTVANGTLMQMSGGTNDFQGATTVSGAGTGSLQWDNSGSVTLSSGTLTVNSGASLNVGNVVVSGTGALTMNSGSTLNVSSGTLGNTGAITVNGAMNWTGGVIAGPGTLDVNGVLSMTTSANRYLSNRTLNHTNTSGSSGWDGAGQWLIDTGAVFRNAVGGKFNVASGGSDLNSSSGTGTFDNQGLLTKSGAGSVRIGPSGTVAFSNSGTVDVTGGTLQSFDGGTHVGGTFTVANGTLMQMSGGTNDFQGATTVSGAGTGSLQWDNSGSVTLSSGTLTVNSGASLNVGNVVVSGTGALTMNSGSTLNVSSGTLGNTGAITVNGAMNWTGGVIAGPGTLDVNGVLSMTTSANRYLSNRTLNHTNTSGSSGWDGAGQWLIDTGAVFRNAVGGKFNVASGGSDLNSSSGTGTFDNQGLLTKSGAGSVRIGPSGTVAFSNSGTVDVTGGTLQSFDGGTHVGGTFTVANGTLMQMSGGTNDFQGATTVSGAGTGSLQWDNSGSVTLSSGTLTVNSGASLNVGNVVVSGTGALTMNSGSTLNVSSGTLGNTGAVTVNGAMNWTGGYISGPGTLDVNGVLSMTGPTLRILSNRTLNHTNASGASTADLTGSWNIENGAVFLNAPGAKFTINTVGGQDINSSVTSGTFDNQGLLTKTGTGLARIGPGGTVVVSNTGTIDVTNGVLQLFDGITQSGTLNIAAGASFDTAGNSMTNAATGVISGAGTLNLGGLSLINDGAIRPGGAGTVGTLSINGNYSQNSGGSLDVDLASVASYDVMAVTGSAALAGTLNVNYLGGYTGAGGSHTLISSPTVSGTFGTINDANALAQQYGSSYFVLGALVNTWLYDGSDSWLNTARWSLGHVPTSSEDVIVPDYTSLFTVTIPSGAQVAKSIVLQGNDIFAVNGGSFTFTNASSISNGTLHLFGGAVSAGAGLTVKDFGITSNTLTGAGGLTVTNSYSSAGGTINLGGAISITQAAGNLTINNSISAGALTLSATAGTISQTAPLTVTGTSNINAGANAITLINASNDFQGAVTLANLSGQPVSITDINSISFGPALILGGPFTVTAPTIALNGVSNTGNQQYNGNASLAGSFPTNGGNFTVTGATTLAAATAVNVGTGNANFGTVDGGQTLTVNSSGTETFGNIGGAVALASITTDAPGTVVLNGNVTTSGSQTFNDAVTAAGRTFTSAGGNITAANPANNITGTTTLNAGGPVSLSNAGSLTLTSAGPLTLGSMSTGGDLTVTTTGAGAALGLGSGSIGGNLSAATNNGSIGQSGGLTVVGTTNAQAGTGSISLASLNDFQGLVTAGGAGGISLTDVNTLPANIINAGAGTVILTAGTIAGSGPVTGGSASLSSDTDVTGMNVIIGGNFDVSGAATLWNLTGTILGTVSAASPATTVILNGATLLAGVLQVQQTSSPPQEVCVGVIDAATGACSPPTPPPPPQVLQTPPPPAGAPPAPDPDPQAQSGTTTETGGTTTIDDGSSQRKKRAPRCG